MRSDDDDWLHPIYGRPVRFEFRGYRSTLRWRYSWEYEGVNLTSLAGIETEAADRMAGILRPYQDRIRIILPRVGEFASIAAVVNLYR